MNIDFSKFLFKCDIDDCGKNVDHVCCVSCGLFDYCNENGYVCTYLDEHNNNPEDCPELYLKNNNIQVERN
jgi:hypothetical protein